MKSFELFTVLLSLCFMSGEAAHYIPVIDENYVDCGHSGYIDFEGLELHAVNDTHTSLNGKLTFKKEIHSPWTVVVSSQRFNRGKWYKGEVNRRISDLCLDLKDPLEPWYPITGKMKHNSCPIPPGSVEEFDMLTLAGFNIEIPATFQGLWKIKIDMVFKDLPGMKKEEECIEVSFEIREV